MPPSAADPQQYYAHTSTLEDGKTTNPDKTTWEPLFTPFEKIDLNDPSKACSGNNGTPCPHCENLEPHHGHLNKVAYITAKFAAEMFPDGADRESARQWGYITGLWHDLGKFSDKFQDYLAHAADVHSDEIGHLEKVDHTTAGAKHAVSSTPLGHIIATAIAGHHSGLLDARSEHASLEKRLLKETEATPLAPKSILNLALPSLPAFLATPNNDYALALFQRMLFSCLVDADFLATESFMNPTQAIQRPPAPMNIFPKSIELLEKKIADFGQPESSVNHARASVVKDCMSSAEKRSGLFTLTVPTGGGKTLSSLAFALKHAIAHGHRRIIYVIPFTSIIEQNASVFTDLLESLGKHVVLEHHSNLSPDKETNTSRLAAENWDAPIVVTTAVQFYESLFAAKTSRSRKIHNIANSVVILDEAQSLPVQYLNPCLRTLEQLATHYHTTTVLCTATQPAINRSEEFPIGLEKPTEIISDTYQLFHNLDRVKIHYRETLDNQIIASELANSPQALCIVNTRKHAQSLYQALPHSDENFHLSALMCPEHRLKILKTVRKRLDDALPTHLISTQLIEAGVDIDFPVVYRSMAGLDSIAQAAGRCNRNGKIAIGHVHVFHSEHTSSETYFQETANVGHEILDLYKNAPLSTDAVHAYFTKYYYQQKSKWDAKNILPEFACISDPKLPLLFQYKTTAEKFKLIENNQIPVIIPWDKTAKELIEKELRNETIPIHRKLLRFLQRYTVQIYENQFYKHHYQFESIRNGQFHILICPETHYSEDFGLNVTDEAANSKTLIS